MSIIRDQPKFEQLRKLLAKDIAKGKYAPGEKVPSETALAKAYGMNRETVNKAISNLVAEGVLRRERGRGTFVAEKRENDVPAGLRIGVLITPSLITNHQGYTDLYNYTDVYGGLVDAAQELGVVLKIYSKDHVEDVKDGIEDFIRKENLAGMISYDYNDYDEELADGLRELGKPYTVVACWRNDVAVSLSTCDTERGVASAVEHLLSLGHQRIVYVTWRLVDRSLSPRLNGFQNTLRKNGVVLNKDWIVELDHQDDLTQKLEIIFGAGPFPTAVMVSSDPLAIYVSDFLRGRGLSIPGVVSLLGIDDMERAAKMTPPLTSLRIPRREMGYESVAMTTEMIRNGETGPVERVAKTALKVRGSTERVGA